MDCCSVEEPCDVHQGHCDDDSECMEGLICSDNYDNYNINICVAKGRLKSPNSQKFGLETINYKEIFA